MVTMAKQTEDWQLVVHQITDIKKAHQMMSLEISYILKLSGL
jgi:hypothetical protein